MRHFEQPVNGELGARYRLEIETRADTTDLAPNKPRIIVRTSGSLNEDEAVKTAFIWFVALVIGGAGLTLGVGAVVYSRTR
jgi:hypothetical protein